jgi:DNA ligase-1
METSFKPMKAALAPDDLRQLPYPVIVSPKLDGIRAIRWQDKLITHRGEPIPNRHVTKMLCGALPHGVEGELCLPDLTARHRHVASAIMSRDGEPEFRFMAFDRFDCVQTSYETREMTLRLIHHKIDQVSRVASRKVDTVLGLLHAMDESTCAGYEGLIIRDPAGGYVRGRCTTKEGPTWKLKSFADEEAVVIGFEEEVSIHGEPKGRLGALHCTFLGDDVHWKVGSGFTADERELYWPGERLLGKLVTVKHQPPPGGRRPGEKPRFPVFLRVRED